MLDSRKTALLLVPVLLLLFSQLQATERQCHTAKNVPGKTTKGCIIIDGIKRTYYLHVPLGYRMKKQSLALVMGLHGGGGNPLRFENYSRMSKMSDRKKDFIAVYPEGINKHWNDGRADVNAGVNDVKFLKHLAKDIDNVNDKVFIVGLSNGGLMAMRMACEQPGWIAGIGVVAASMTTELAATCPKSSKPMTAVFIFGRKDTSFLDNGIQVNPVKPKEQRGTHIGIDRTVKKWIDINQCNSSFEKKSFNRDPADGTQVLEKSFRQCKQPVVFYDIKNGGHRWPDYHSRNGVVLRKALNLGVASHDINAIEKIWEVFKKSKSP